ncbi:hypothetical protein D3C85_1131980 [compost metagenome]
MLKAKKVKSLITYLNVTEGKIYTVVVDDNYPTQVGVIDDLGGIMYLHEDYYGTKEYIVEEVQ